MEYNFITNIESCYVDIPNLLYYSHIPTALVATFIGFFVFLKDKRSLVSKILFFIGILFSIWSIFDIILWVAHSSGMIMFPWSLINLVEMLVSVLTLYFAYVFIEKKDISWKFKALFGGLLGIFIILIPTTLNLTGFTMTVCEAAQGPLLKYFYFLEVLFSFWLVMYLAKKIITTHGEDRKKTVYLSLGVVAFLFSFSGTNIIGSLTENWEILQYGLFGMVIFMGFLAYLIVKFKAFDIKMLAAQALVVALVALVASEFFFVGIENVTVTILISVTVLLAAIFGIWLINSVKKEEQRKEELQLMSGKLSEANDQLRRLDNSKSEFISIASHQLRTPLTAIKGFVSLLLEGSYGKVDPKQGEVLNKVYASNERMVNLVEDLLNVSRMESGRMEFKFAPWKVADICQEVVDTFYPKAKNLGLYLDYKKPETELPEVMIDGTKVREVISNLVDNALKYTPKGGVNLKVEQADENIRVTVSDTGIGVPATELPYLFAKFSRGKDISRLNTGGTGLGLFVGKSMIEQNGGKIWAESDGEGKGSRFIIEIPLRQSKELLERWG